MGKPLSGNSKLPFGVLGIIVAGAKLYDGTQIKNLRIIKQRSDNIFDLLDVNTNTIHKKLQLTGITSAGIIIQNNSTDDSILSNLSNSSFYIRITNQSNVKQ